MRTRPESGSKRKDNRKKIVYLLGSGISESLSPGIHNKAYHELGLDIEYDLCDISEEHLDSTFARLLQDDRVVGFNVTIPFKEKIIPHLRKLDSVSRTAHAVNLVSIPSGRRSTTGYNTDIDGIIVSLTKLSVLGRAGQRAVLLGAGGAARGCLYAMLGAGFESVKILNRTERRAAEVAGDFSKLYNTKKIMWAPLDADNFTRSILETDLLVNTIPLDAELPFPIDLSRVTTRMKVFDLNYRKISPVLQAAQSEGIQGIDGLLMLVEQAAKSFEILTGISAPRKTMMLAARKQLAVQEG